MVLKLGSTGDDVKKLQTKLGLTADGSFGQITEQKVKEWQTTNKLTADGIVGDTTWGLMFPNTTIIQPEGLNLDKLKGHIPDEVLEEIPDTAKKFNITNNLRLAHFLAQCSHESGGFKVMKENLNYSSDGLKKIFPKYFPGTLSESYARQPEKIGSRVYANRMGNGDEKSKEGFKFSGKGYIQLTGKQNYTEFSKFIGEDCVTNPDLVATKYPLASAAFFFNKNELWSICDKGSSDNVVTSLTKKINGGVIGLEERIKHFKEYYNLLK